MKLAILILLTLLQLLDIYTTYKVLKEGGRETNKLVKWLMDKVDVLPALIGSKALITIGLIAAYIITKGLDWIFYAVMIPVTIRYILVIWHNYLEMQKSK